MKIRIKIGIIGYLPFKFNKKVITNWKSEIFDINKEVDEYFINVNSDTEEWGYSDDVLEKELPANNDSDIFIGISYIPLEDNYYARRLKNNRLVISYYEIIDYLKEENIPSENFLLRIAYEFSLVYLRYDSVIPKQIFPPEYTHDDTRGCIFDMNGVKEDIVYSLDRPILCDKCTNDSRSAKVSDSKIQIIKKELKKIKKGYYYKIIAFIKRKPIMSIVLSILFGIIINILGVIIYDVFLENIIN